MNQAAGDSLAEGDYVFLWKDLFSLFLEDSTTYARGYEFGLMIVWERRSEEDDC